MQAELSRLRVVASDALPEVETDEPSREGMPTPGGYIREQRLRLGLSVEQLAIATKIPVASIRLLEADEFDSLPGPVFVKGFLRCCTRALGLPDETVMELLYERERAALLAHRQQQRPAVAPSSGSEVEPLNGQALAVPSRGNPRPNANGSVIREALLSWPRANALLWLVVAAFVAVMVMAAFNVAGDSPVGPHA